MTEQLRRAPVGSAALQELIEDLAESLRRSVAVADPLVRLICSSRHFDDADPARVYSLLQGQASSEVTRHVLDQGVTQRSKPGFIEGRDDLGLLPRYCVPLRERGHFLGLLMVVAPDTSLAPEVSEAIARATPAIVGQMYADHVLADAEKTREQKLLLSLLGSSPVARAESRKQLLDDALLPDAPHAVVSVVQVARSHVSPGQVATALRGALEGFRRTRSANGAFAVTSDRAVLLQLADRPLKQEALREQSTHIMEALGTHLDASAAPVIGIGGHQTGLAEAWTSYEQALVAVRAARRMPELNGIGSWEELGEFAVLLQLPDRTVDESLLPKPLRALLESSGGHRLEKTLRCFLDQAGSIPRTAEALQIHRTSLYYRLRQIQEITGLDLDNGADRITLHLGLRIRELLVPAGVFGDDGQCQGQAATRGGDLVGRGRSGGQTLGADPQGRRSASVRRGRQFQPQRTSARRDRNGQSVAAGDHGQVEAA
ncbi:CdaR family transcriptional regulator [Streptomyces sp. Ncost-T10-10d]|uniref:PucR family transcriptional regulator n=1 Tax=Streptomyces sp. Ncost-T10-10d TaxID=1839774 RepID=UPI00081DC174|nr:helix-turn-helix domain-containing protein [Streptomyces sp. Ncost-T10-10d]SCF84848.1 Sugar diacid utilization regulator [Streptomyces sp. Ncost-T10-10d]